MIEVSRMMSKYENWDDYLKYMKYCKDVIEYYQRLNENTPKRFQISYDDIC